MIFYQKMMIDWHLAATNLVPGDVFDRLHVVAGAGNAFGCDAGVCGAPPRTDFPFAKVELTADGGPGILS